MENVITPAAVKFTVCHFKNRRKIIAKRHWCGRSEYIRITMIRVKNEVEILSYFFKLPGSTSVRESFIVSTRPSIDGKSCTQWSRHEFRVRGLPSLCNGQIPATRQDTDVKGKNPFVDCTDMMRDVWRLYARISYCGSLDIFDFDWSHAPMKVAVMHSAQ